MKKILVTGSCGFIMSNFIKKNNENYYMIGLDKINFKHSMPETMNNFYLADIRDRHIIDNIFRIEKPDLILHGAAETHVDNSLSDPSSFVTSNILGTQVLIDCAVKYNVEKFILVSTDEVYGQLEDENAKSWKEDESLNPRNPYSATKASSELMVMAANKSHGLQYNITRSSNNYGPKQIPEKLIPKTIKSILKNESIPVYGKGLQIRDWTYVDDNCNGLMLVLKNGKNNEAYNISANNELTNINVVNKICDIIGKGQELITYIKDPRKSHDFRYSIDTTKIRNLGWLPETSFEYGLKKTIEWYLDNLWIIN